MTGPAATAEPRATLRVVLRVTIVAAVVLALVAVETTSRSGVLWRMVTFTYQANVLAALFYLATLLAPRLDARAGWRGAVVLYVTVAGLVWNTYLTDMSMGYTAANTLLHVVVPVLALADWVLVGRDQRLLRWWQPVVWLGYPAVYLGVALLVLNSPGRRGPYYFLDPGSVGAAGVGMNVALLAAAMLAIGYLIALLGRTAAGFRGGLISR